MGPTTTASRDVCDVLESSVSTSSTVKVVPAGATQRGAASLMVRLSAVTGE
jgi:hypothetical protein